MIIHTVVFRLKHPTGSAAEATFIEKGKALASISTVNNFQVFKQVSAKNNFAFGFSMEFEDQAAYDTYNEHPEHVAFVKNIWMKEVEDFMEIDYVAY